MQPNPFLGVFLHWLGGLASGSFYVPFRGVKRWSWETYWMAGGIFSWILAPWAFAFLNTNELLTVISQTPSDTFWQCFGFGLLWGFGGLTFGLTMRYLGYSLGTAVALGYCAVFGTLIPPIVSGDFKSTLIHSASGIWILMGVLVCVAGIAIAGYAGRTKEREMPPEQKQASIREFNFKKGIAVATFCGVMSACFAFGLAAGEPVKAITMKYGTAPIWQGLPVLCIVLLGGFTTNFVWSMILHVRNRSLGEYVSRDFPLLRNYLFSALAGVTWYFQFFFYSMGETQMGRFGFSSWTLHMASIIIFSTLWGLYFGEWKNASPKAMRLVVAGIGTLILSTIVVGYGNYLGASLG
ncbi:MAG: L-rhamnose/proton symporter RhaT [Acidobacteria bacterium]|nr:L-rhamnose/proton symporter RhaT [Acidobacteriota bacterium]